MATELSWVLPVSTQSNSTTPPVSEQSVKIQETGTGLVFSSSTGGVDVLEITSSPQQSSVVTELENSQAQEKELSNRLNGIISSPQSVPTAPTDEFGLTIPGTNVESSNYFGPANEVTNPLNQKNLVGFTSETQNPMNTETYFFISKNTENQSGQQDKNSLLMVNTGTNSATNAEQNNVYASLFEDIVLQDVPTQDFAIEQTILATTLTISNHMTNQYDYTDYKSPFLTLISSQTSVETDVTEEVETEETPEANEQEETKRATTKVSVEYAQDTNKNVSVTTDEVSTVSSYKETNSELVFDNENNEEVDNIVVKDGSQTVVSNLTQAVVIQQAKSSENEEYLSKDKLFNQQKTDMMTVAVDIKTQNTYDSLKQQYKPILLSQNGYVSFEKKETTNVESKHKDVSQEETYQIQATQSSHNEEGQKQK